jgi:phosphohistidine phosphatase SixA
MSELYIASHGETNIDRPYELSPRGRDQASRMAERFAEIITDRASAAIVTSSATRTMQAGAIVSGVTGIKTRFPSTAIWEASEAEEKLDADGAHFLAHAVMSKHGLVTAEFSQILIVSHPEMLNGFADGDHDPTHIHRIPDISEAMERQLPVIELITRNL